MARKGMGMTIPKSESTREKWGHCRSCGVTIVACKGLTRDRGHGCCKDCTHSPKEATDATE